MLSRYGTAIFAVMGLGALGTLLTTTNHQNAGVAQSPGIRKIARLPHRVTARTVDLSLPAKGRYRYRPGSPGFIYRDFSRQEGPNIPYRQGNGQYGFTQVVNTSDTSTAVIAATVTYGKETLAPGHSRLRQYEAWFYNPSLPAGDPYRKATIIVTISLLPMRDGLAQGIMTATALDYPGQVPKWLAGPNPKVCVFGGGGVAP